jgi:beta-glucosidase
LAETIPLREGHLPTVGNFPGDGGHVRYGEGLLVGYRWYDRRELAVAYPFGHGLSYTTFDYTDLQITGSAGDLDYETTLSFTLQNTGGRSGAEVAQVYVGARSPRVGRPVRELKAFRKVLLEPGESRRIDIALDESAFAHWSTRAGRWVVSAGVFDIWVGASSRDLRLQGEQLLQGNEPACPLDEMSTVADWLADPVGGPSLRGALAGSSFESLLLSSGESRLLQSFPLRRLMRFPGFPLNGRSLEEILARIATSSIPAPAPSSR